MLQDRPYLPRTINECRCHTPCKDFYATGKQLWAWHPLATGAFEGFRYGVLLYEVEGGDGGCWWQSDEPPPVVDRRVGLLAQLRMSPAIGIGIPMPVFWGMTAISWSTDWGVEIYVAEAARNVMHQIDCRQAGDVELVITANPAGRFPHSTLPGDSHWQWRARRDRGVPS